MDEIRIHETQFLRSDGKKEYLFGDNWFQVVMLADHLQQLQARQERIAAQQGEIERLQRARIADSEIIGRWQCEAENAKSKCDRMTGLLKGYRDEPHYGVPGEHGRKMCIRGDNRCDLCKRTDSEVGQ